MKLSFGPQTEAAPRTQVDLGRVRSPEYGRYLDAFVDGQVFAHPRGYTFHAASMTAFARTFMQCCPLYLNQEYAKAHGLRDIVASPQMVFNVVLSLGVQNDSEKAMANLGYYNAQFLRPVFPGDTLRSMTRVLRRTDRGAGKPGIAHIQTLGMNQRGEVVLQYERKIMVTPQGDRPPASPAVTGKSPTFPWAEDPVVDFDDLKPVANMPSLTGQGTYFEDFAAGDIIVHGNGRTITDEHVALTYAVGNTHPLHFDRVYSKGLSGAMSGEPIVYGGLVFAWLEGLASRDLTENALWEVGFTEGYHTQPAVSGDTVFALSRILGKEDAPGALVDHAGVVTVQFLGIKGMTARAALEAFGADLFVKENDKKDLGKEKIPAKIFEIERRILLKKRPR